MSDVEHGEGAGKEWPQAGAGVRGGKTGLRRERFEFTGKGGEYFGIVFVNNLLNILTLWFYSPWAKIRRLQYFYGSTQLAGGAFRFTANPWRMLRSRVIAVALLILFVVADFLANEEANSGAQYVYFGLLFLYFAFAPILTVFVLSFRFRYSQWRAIPFGFNKNFRQAYRVYLLPMAFLALLVGCFSLPALHEEIGEALGLDLSVEVQPEPELEETLELFEGSAEEGENSSSLEEGEAVAEEPEDEGPFYQPHPSLWIPAGIAAVLFLLLLPYFDFISMRFVVSNARLGTSRFSFYADARDFYVLYAKYLLVVLLPLLCVIALAVFADVSGMFGILTVAGFLLLYPATQAYFKSQRYNIMLNNAQFDDYKHRLVAEVPVLGMFWISVTNTLAILLSLGLLIPWAQVRTIAFLLKHTELLVAGSLDSFIMGQEGDENALAEEVADVFDLDFIG